MKNLTSLISAIALFSGAATRGQTPAAKPADDPVVGHWRPSTAIPIFLAADGSASDRDRQGKWKCLTPNATPRKYRIIWNDGVWIDILSLVKGGKELAGENQDHAKLRWIRVPE
jgi:hypothetical protein